MEMTVREVAAILCVSTARVRTMIAEGQIAATKRPRQTAGGDEWVVAVAELKRVQRKREAKHSRI